MKNLLILLTTALTAGLLLHACATPEPATESDEETVADREPFAIFDFSDEFVEAYVEEVELENMNQDERLLYQSRSRLNEMFATQTHDMPEFFLQQVEEEEVDIYQGFRIQILSTREIELADSTLAEFEQWADTTIADYSPRGYVHFRQPYYRVRVGDFHNRERAIQLSRLIKFKYPDAWVIHDQINPYHVPADTLEFRIADVDNPGEIE